MRYGFAIDQNRCIGCHACTVACKEEHGVPIGVFRTWVKYIEKGEYPHTSRHFGVLRCNHCEEPPCVDICPTRALFRRPDGIVDFDSRRCIGCKSCMQACPYDALYIDPRTLTAAKCNFCAHRIEARLEPACVIVCPTQAILAGDLDDPSSRISRVVASEQVSVRKPEKETQPKLFYLGIDDQLLQPTSLSRDQGYLWADRRTEMPPPEPAAGLVFDSSVPREVYDVAHPAPWGWKIAAYLWTKSVAAGVLLVAAWLLGMGLAPPSTLLGVVSPSAALVALAVTSFLLVVDLKRPGRFYYLLTKSNFRSWLVIGAWILMAYGLLATVWLMEGILAGKVDAVVAWAAGVLAAASAGYSAFLFAQAKGRDLWQSPIFLWHLLAQAFTAGSAILFLAALSTGAPSLLHSLSVLLLVSLFAGVALVLTETALPPASEDVRLVHRALLRGHLSRRFWILTLGLGSAAPMILAALALRPGWVEPAGALASLLALAGLWWFERLWIDAGQFVPLS